MKLKKHTKYEERGKKWKNMITDTKLLLMVAAHAASRRVGEVKTFQTLPWNVVFGG